MKLSADAHGTKIRGRNLINSQVNGRFATDSQVCKLTTDNDERAGTFHQTQPTTGDTACSVKGVRGLGTLLGPKSLSLVPDSLCAT